MKKFIVSVVLLAVFVISTAYAAEVVVSVDNKVCPVSHEEVGTGGMEPYQVTHNGKTYNLCCSGCEKEFLKDPDKYSKVADDEVAAKKM